MHLENISIETELDKLLRTLYSRLISFVRSHEPKERLRKQYPQHSLFCECPKCLPADHLHRKMLRELKESMS